MSVSSWLKSLLPVKFVNEAEKVAPEVQLEIDRLVNGVTAQVAALKASHSVQSVKDKLAADLADFEAFHARHVALLKAEADAKLAAANAILPPLVLPTVTAAPAAPAVKTW